MEIPSKIYIRRTAISCLSENKDRIAHAYVEVAKKDYGDWIEFTNLSEVWHDARKEKHPEGVCGNNPVVVVGLRKGRISYRYLWENMEYCWLDIEQLALCKAYDKALWAYLRELVPGVKPRGL